MNGLERSRQSLANNPELVLVTRDKGWVVSWRIKVSAPVPPISSSSLDFGFELRLGLGLTIKLFQVAFCGGLLDHQAFLQRSWLETMFEVSNNEYGCIVK